MNSVHEKTRSRLLLTFILIAFTVSLFSLPVKAFSETFVFSATLDGAQEVPPVITGGTGSAIVIYDDTSNVLAWIVSFSGLSGPATAAHFHGPAAQGVDAGVQVGISVVSGTDSPLVGTATIDETQEADLLAEMYYINVHTAANPGGEIRGQVEIASPSFLGALLDGAQEVPPVDTSGAGSAGVVYDETKNVLAWIVSFSGLSGPATAAHFHGPAVQGVDAGVQVGISVVSGTDSPLVGTATIDETQEADLLAGLYYINVHTAANPGGEIRGQVEEAPATQNFLSALLDGAQEVPPVITSGMGSAIVIYEETSNILAWIVSFSGLSGPATAAHFHGPAVQGVDAGVQVGISVVSGTDSPLVGTATIDETQEADLLAGLYYINVHTAANPGGEIRGQVEETEPAAAPPSPPAMTGGGGGGCAINASESMIKDALGSFGLLILAGIWLMMRTRKIRTKE